MDDPHIGFIIVDVIIFVSACGTILGAMNQIDNDQPKHASQTLVLSLVLLWTFAGFTAKLIGWI